MSMTINYPTEILSPIEEAVAHLKSDFTSHLKKKKVVETSAQLTEELRRQSAKTISESSLPVEPSEKLSQKNKVDSFFVMDVLSESFFP